MNYGVVYDAINNNKFGDTVCSKIFKSIVLQIATRCTIALI